ncbi:MAG: PorP/SprF family type IX secretion system membrane protein [Bacteroidales bacterium]|nr:PorP/SprF family type IX secretion system membrane protein [Bacteroidales bacterium]
MNKRIFFLILLIFTKLLFVNAQDFHFSQFYDAPILLNPALTGSFSGAQRANISFRNQWAKIINPYETYSVSFDSRLSGKHSRNGYLSVGIAFMKDKAGKSDLATTQGLVSLSFHQRVQKDGYLSGGLQGGMTQKTINYTNLAWDNQYDPNIPGFDLALPNGEAYLSDNFSYTDVSAGVVYSYESSERAGDAIDRLNFNLGAAYYNFVKTDKSFTVLYNNPMYPRLVFHGKGILGIHRTSLYLVPVFMFQKQGPHREIVLGTGLKKELIGKANFTGLNRAPAFTLGYLVRTGDAFIPYISIDIAGFSLGISYDANFSDLKKASKRVGGFEISLAYINLGSKGNNNLPGRNYRRN